MRMLRFGGTITDMQARLRRAEKSPGYRSIANKTITGTKLVPRTIPTRAIAQNAVTAAEASFGTTVVTATPPTDPTIVKEGLTVVDPGTGAVQVYSDTSNSYVDVTDPAAASAAIAAAAAAATAAVTAGTAAVAALVAQSTADGKNTVYRSGSTPTGKTAVSVAVTNKALTTNVATITTASAHGLSAGDTVAVTGIDATFNGSYIIATIPTGTTFTYALVASNVTSIAATGTIIRAAVKITIGDTWFDTSNGNLLKTYTGVSGGWVSVQDLAIAAAQSTADGKNTVYRQGTLPTTPNSPMTAFATGDMWFDTANDNKMYRYATASTFTVSNKALTSNVATITTSAAHDFTLRDLVTLTGVDSTFNGVFFVTGVPSTTSFTYNLTHADVTSAVATGTATTPAWRAVAFGTSALGVIDASVVNVSNINAGNISAGYIASGRIAAGTIIASQIAAGTITATQIDAGYAYVGSVVATQITTGNLTATLSITGGGSISAGSGAITLTAAGAITTSSGNFSVSALGVLSATSAIITGTITGSTFTTPNYATNTGIGITSSGLVDSIIFTRSGTPSASIVMDTFSGLTIQGDTSNLYIGPTPTSALDVISISTSHASNSGANGHLRNIWADGASTAPSALSLATGYANGDVFLAWT
jgi:hypothetical protein